MLIVPGILHNNFKNDTYDAWVNANSKIHPEQIMCLPNNSHFDFLIKPCIFLLSYKQKFNIVKYSGVISAPGILCQQFWSSESEENVYMASWVTKKLLHWTNSYIKIFHVKKAASGHVEMHDLFLTNPGYTRVYRNF